MKIQLTAETTLCYPTLEKALEALREGCEEQHLIEHVDFDDLAVLYYYLEELKKHAFLRYSTPFLDMLPFHGDFSVEHFENVPHHLSRFTLCRPLDGKMVIENPLGSARGYLSQEGMELLYALSTPQRLEELALKFPEHSLNDIRETLSLLKAGEMIVSVEEESAPLMHWEFHDLYFHTRSRQGRTDSRYGGTFRFKKILPSQPSIKPCTNLCTIPLHRPEKELTLSLEATLEKRKSIREQGQDPITLKQLGEFLWRSARVKDQKQLSNESFTTRPYPGGGARYELEIYPVIYRCDGVKPGVYHYHPLEHQLCAISDLTKEAEQLLKDACRSTGKQDYPQVLFLLSARFQRVSWKYQSMAYAVILKNLGVLLQTMYLVATASDLAPCAIGGGDSDLFCKVIGTNYLEETSVGEFMLGSLP